MVTRLVAPWEVYVQMDVTYLKTTDSPVGILVDLGRARSNQSLVRPERVAGSDGLSIHLERQSQTQFGFRLRETLYLLLRHMQRAHPGVGSTHKQ